MRRRDPAKRALWCEGWRCHGRTAGRARRNLMRRSGWAADRGAVVIWHREGQRWVQYRERPHPDYLNRGPLWVKVEGGAR